MIVKKSVQLQNELSVAHQDFKKMLNAHAFAKVHDTALSEDLVQQAFMKTGFILSKMEKLI